MATYPLAAGRVLNQTLVSYLPDAKQPWWRRLLFIVSSVAVSFTILPLPVVSSDPSHLAVGFEVFPDQRQHFRAADNTPAVWIVEESDSHELYSNGLRIETGLATRNTQRFYQVLDRGASLQASREWYSVPAGIVFHTTESPQAPFEAEQNTAIQRLGRALLQHVVTNRSYNYLIDRFGRVFRVVDELDAAHHAGNSVWAHGRSLYLNVNNSFLGVSFESAGEAPLTVAQTTSGRLLTQLLRNKYRIPMENCVTHAQVSVNPQNLRIGYHTDGGRAFPFLDLGLPNNYDLPLVSLLEFGFAYDDAFRDAMGPRVWQGLKAAEQQLQDAANKSGKSIEEYRAGLQARYQQLYAEYKEARALDESSGR